MEWDLFRRGRLDQERHHELVREAVRKNLKDLVSHGDLIVQEGGKKVRVPVRELREYRFRFAPEGQPQPGTGTPRPGKGQVLGKLPAPGDSQGQGHGQGEETGVYEVEIGVSDVAAAIFAGLELPNLKPREKIEQPSPDLRVEEIRRRGAFSNLDKRRTVLENIRRNALDGDAHFGGLLEDDLRFRVPEELPSRQDRVAAVFLRDCSGSMGDERKYLSRVLAFWILEFLRLRYRSTVDTAFILHHMQAWEVSQDDFFHLSEGGGTSMTPAYELALDLVHERFPPSRYNVYAFHFTDGDASDDDGKALVPLMNLAAGINLFGYADVTDGGPFTRMLLRQERPPQLTIAHVPDRNAMVQGIRTLLSPRGVKAS